MTNAPINPTKKASRRYLVEFWLAMAGYVFAMWLSRSILLRGHDNDTLSPLQLAAAAIPLLPVIALFIAILRYIRGTDELMRRILIDSLAIAGGITALLAVTYGLLESPSVPHLSAWWTYGVFMGAFGVASGFVRRRYK